MKKILRILLLSLLITILAAACGKSEIVLEEGETTPVETLAAEPAEDARTATESEAVSESSASDTAVAAEVVAPTPARVCVYVCGEVVTPGVYELAEGARIYEALMLAGGLTENADITIVNQAQELSDGMMIRIPTIGESDGQTPVLSGTDAGGDTQGAEPTGLVNINTADAAELCTLPGIGAAKAAAIIAYREQNGSYTSKEALMNVSGIGDSTYRNLESQITVGQ